MNTQQLPQLQIPRDKCVEITERAILIIGNAGSSISSLLSLSIALIAVIMSAISFIIAFYSLWIQAGLLAELAMHGIGVLAICLAIIASATIVFCIIYSELKHMGLRYAKIIRNTLIEILASRKDLLKQCSRDWCSQSNQELFCQDIKVLLNSIEDMEKLRVLRLTRLGAASRNC